MLPEQYSVRFFWGPRAEDIQQCASRLHNFLSQVRNIHPLLGKWCRPGGNKSLESLSTKAIEKLLATEGTNRTEAGNKPIADLGYSITFTNGRVGSHAADLMIGCGKTTQHVKNVCSVSLPTEGEDIEGLVRLPTLLAYCKLVVSCWEPDNGVVLPYDFEEKFSQSSKPVQIGWITYLSARLMALPELPESVQTHEFNSLGHFLVLAPSALTSQDPAHVSLVKRVAGLCSTVRSRRQ